MLSEPLKHKAKHDKLVLFIIFENKTNQQLPGRLHKIVDADPIPCP